MSMRIVLLSAIVSILFIDQGMAKRVRYGEVLCSQSRYECLLVKKGDTWRSLWPDSQARGVIQRINRMNVLRSGMTLAVPKSTPPYRLMDYAPFPRRRTAVGEKMIIMSPARLAWAAYDPEGNLIRWGPASFGKRHCPDLKRGCLTVRGNYRIFHKGSRRCVSSKFPLGRGGAPMPYCMFFYRGYAIHGSPQVPGYHASHGCVRVFNQDARWLNEVFVDLPRKGSKGTKVIVYPYHE